MRLTVDRSICIGSGNCVRLADHVFAQDDHEGLVVLRSDVDERASGEDPAATAEQIRRAVEACPVGAISFEAD